MDAEQLFLAHLPLIEEVAAKTCRRRHLRPEDAEDFLSLVRMKFFTDDYQVLRRFQGRSSFPTYVTTVVQHLFLDYCNQNWGRFRSSTEARRRGPLAIELETLLVRDQLAPAEALRILANRHPELADKDIAGLADGLPVRVPRTRDGEEALEQLPSLDSGPETDLVEADRERASEAARRALQSALQHLPSEDRLVLRLRAEEGLPVSDIARSLGLDAKALYRRLNRLYRDLKGDLAERGISSTVMRAEEEPPPRYDPAPRRNPGPPT
jgi:RNA polymerase sigma factor (sigma-70 family)